MAKTVPTFLQLAALPQDVGPNDAAPPYQASKHMETRQITRAALESIHPAMTRGGPRTRYYRRGLDGTTVELEVTDSVLGVDPNPIGPPPRRVVAPATPIIVAPAVDDAADFFATVPRDAKPTNEDAWIDRDDRAQRAATPLAARVVESAILTTAADAEAFFRSVGGAR